MFKKLTLFSLLLAVTGIFSVAGVDAQRLVVRKAVKTTDSVSKSIDPALAEPLAEPEANESVTLNQCENGGLGDPVQNCGAGGTNDNWNTGNMNGQKAHYAEGKSIHYRAVFGNLTPGTTYTIVLGYDITKGAGIHAIDYLNNYDADITAPVYTVTPCGSLVNSVGHACNTNTIVQIPIQDDPDVPNSIEPPAGRFITAWGIEPGAPEATLTYGTVEERLITINFTPTVSNPVFGWSGHIALGAAWQAFNGGTGAGSINGSPYHMYNRGGGENDFSGSQDLQLATSAITQPSAAGAEVSGRVTDAYGRAISGAQLTLFNATTGDPVVVFTNTFGYYSFSDVPVGEFYVLSVAHRRYIFMNGSVSFSLEDNLAGLDFRASR